MNQRKTLPIALLGVVILAGPAFADATPEGLEFFEKKIRPALVEHCYSCHATTAKKVKGGFLLDSRANLLKGGGSGVPAVMPGQPEKSKLIEAIHYKNVDLQMPPRAKLPDGVIADFTAWVKMGAPWGKESAVQPGSKYTFDLAQRKKEHWAWQPIRPGRAPAIKNQAWPLSPVDRFILAKLEDKGLAPAAAADPRTLIRRLYFDVIGLPPAPAEVEAFLKDWSASGANPQAVLEKLVDRLLDSPQFGERWARHWLDLVRYGESRGHEFDYNLPNAYQYRDYVIRALNADVRYDQFVTEHLAGDLMPRPRLHPTEKFNESILGTGFWFLGEQVHSPVDLCQDRADRHDNMIDVMTKTFLGLTVSCARCHDHKFDAISTKDYYALEGYLQSSSYRLACFDSLDENRGLAEALAKLRADCQGPIRKAVAAALEPGIQQADRYLLAAREVLLKKTSGEEAVRLHKLNAEMLDRWVRHLPVAVKDGDDPLHTWARIALDPGAQDAKRFGELLAAIKAGLPKKGMNGGEVVVDYADLKPGQWIQDGYAFGMAPVQAGEVMLLAGPNQPVRINDRAAARTDPAWQSVKMAIDGQAESGSVGRLAGMGQMIRTPSFRVQADRVFCLVRGAGSVFACVEGHIMIAGPLHGNLVQSIRGGPSYHWFEVNIARYKGNRAHVEFTPAGGADFAVALVIQANSPPSIQAVMQSGLQDGIVEAMSKGLEFGRKADEVLIDGAQFYRVLFQTAAEGEPSRRGLSAAVSAWMYQHADLFAEPKEFAKPVAGAAAPFLAEQAKILARVKTRSRLAPAMLDGNGVNENVFLRGSYKTLGEVAPRRLLTALVGTESSAQSPGSGRLQLAQQMTDPALTPLVPRVLVNRVWHHLFGRGIVASVDNFGVLGEQPTHPELLDYLADEFVKDGWSVKRLIRRLVLTRTYQMSSRPSVSAQKTDPDNLLLSHMRVRRLEGEAIRDAILKVSGRLDLAMYGPSVPVYLTPFQDGRGRPASGPLDGNGRRSLYLATRRNFLSPFLLAFDTPIPFSSVGRRTVSNVPAQALILLNDPFVHQQAALWAKRVISEEKTPADRITAMYRTAFSRPPSAAEMQACTEYLESQARAGTMSEAALWADLAHVLFNAKEFIYLN